MTTLSDNTEKSMIQSVPNAMESSLIGPQYHDDQFWKFVESAVAGEPNNFSVAMVPTFAEDFEVLTLEC